MNVRFYVMRAASANAKLLEILGVNASIEQVLRRTDTYNRFHKEQFTGNKLIVLGGLTTLDETNGLTAYYEIRNRDTDELAASFLITTNLVDTRTGALLPIQNFRGEDMADYLVDIPSHGQPRSLSLQPPMQVKYDDIASLVPEATPNSMNGRREGMVLSDDCDSEGRLKEDVDPMFVMFRPQPGEELKNMGPPITRDEHGRRYSFAMMEIRNVNWHRPKLGDTIVSLSADINSGEKWRHTRRWIFDKTTGLLLGISDHTAICIDLDARRAIPIPGAVSQEIKESSLTAYA